MVKHLEEADRREKAQRAAMARWHPDDDKTKTAMH
jgi:hypothetical protein